MALQTGVWVGPLPTGLELQGMLGIEVPFYDRVGGVAWVGAQRHPDGGIDPRDAVVGVNWVPVARPDLVVRLQPGLNVPTGGLGTGFYFTPLSTASFDPYVMGDLVVGSTWLGSLSVVARTPLYDGWDRLRQGPFVRTDLRAARRVGPAVPWLGLSAVRLFPSDPVGAAPDLTELAATGGAVVNASKRWSITAQLRLPLAVSAGAVRQLAGGASVRWVVGRSKHPDTGEGPADGS